MFNLEPPLDDGRCIPEVGDWSKTKHHLLLRYIDIFTSSMKKHKSTTWNGIFYIDLFAGAGIERLKESQTLEWGSPLIAAQASDPFTGIFLCEKDSTKFNALSERVAKYKNVCLFNGDANKLAGEIVKEIPAKSLSLCFLDPYGLHLDYVTLEILAQRRVDLIIFFPDHLDALRNWEKYYLTNPKSNLDKCLGTGADWRQIIDKTPRDKLADKLRDLYVSQIRRLGYKYFEFERVSRPSGHRLYRLIFCSHHELGARFWRQISSKGADGQRMIKFSE